MPEIIGLEQIVLLVPNHQLPYKLANKITEAETNQYYLNGQQ